MIRLQRVGRKNDPSFRVVIVDSREAAQTGKIIEVVGSHDAKASRTELKAERINYWLKMGAKVSNTVNNLLIKKGVLTGKTIDVSSKKLGKKASAAVAAVKAAESAAAKAKADKEKADEEASATAKAKEEAEPSSAEASEGQEPAETSSNEVETPAEPVAEEIPAETPAEVTEEKPSELAPSEVEG